MIHLHLLLVNTLDISGTAQDMLFLYNKSELSNINMGMQEMSHYFFQNQMLISEQKARGEKLSQTKEIRIYTALKMG